LDDLFFKGETKKDSFFTAENERLKLQDPPICNPENHLKHPPLCLCIRSPFIVQLGMTQKHPSFLPHSQLLSIDASRISEQKRILPSLKLTAGPPLKINGWKIVVSFWGPAHLQVRTGNC